MRIKVSMEFDVEPQENLADRIDDVVSETPFHFDPLGRGQIPENVVVEYVPVHVFEVRVELNSQLTIMTPEQVAEYMAQELRLDMAGMHGLANLMRVTAVKHIGKEEK